MNNIKEYFNILSKSILALIQAEKVDCEEKLLEHLTCDGAVCDQKHHHILFEDNTFRVIDVSLAAQQDEIFHCHERCAFMYVDMPASIEYYGDIANPHKISWTNDDLQPRFNMIPFEEMHKVKNVGNTHFRALRFEIKPDIVKLQNFDVLSEKILELIQSNKPSLDLVRTGILELRKALIQAIDDCNFEELKKSYDNGARLEQATSHGFTKLHLAAMCSDDPLEIERLIDSGEEVNAITQDTTPLHLAVMSNPSVNITSKLIEKGANLEVRTQGITVLGVAAQRAKKEILMALVEGEADLLAPTATFSCLGQGRDFVPLDYALSSRDADIEGVKYLIGAYLDKGLDITNIATYFGCDTCLHWAFKQKDPDLVEKIMKKTHSGYWGRVNAELKTAMDYADPTMLMELARRRISLFLKSQPENSKTVLNAYKIKQVSQREIKSLDCTPPKGSHIVAGYQLRKRVH